MEEFEEKLRVLNRELESGDVSIVRNAIQKLNSIFTVNDESRYLLYFDKFGVINVINLLKMDEAKILSLAAQTIMFLSRAEGSTLFIFWSIIVFLISFGITVMKQTQKG